MLQSNTNVPIEQTLNDLENKGSLFYFPHMTILSISKALRTWREKFHLHRFLNLDIQIKQLDRKSRRFSFVNNPSID